MSSNVRVHIMHTVCNVLTAVLRVYSQNYVASGNYEARPLALPDCQETCGCISGVREPLFNHRCPRLRVHHCREEGRERQCRTSHTQQVSLSALPLPPSVDALNALCSECAMLQQSPFPPPHNRRRALKECAVQCSNNPPSPLLTIDVEL